MSSSRACAARRGSPRIRRPRAACGCWRKSVALEHAADNIRLQLGASRHHLHADLGKIPTGAEGNRRMRDRSARAAAAVVPLHVVGEAQDIANGVLFPAPRRPTT